MTDSQRRVFKNFKDSGEWEEYQLIMAIEKFLLTPSQQGWMKSVNLQVGDLLSEESFPASLANGVDVRLYAPWNKELGFEFFQAIRIDNMLTEIENKLGDKFLP